jgi:predicted nucleic acid-binding protein
VITLFVDTNVLLSFFHLTSEDLEELRKLVALIDNEDQARPNPAGQR